MVLAAVLIELGCAAGADARPRPDLVVRSISRVAATAETGTAFEVVATTSNRGRARAGRSLTRVFLVPVAGGARVLAVKQPVRALRPGGRSRSPSSSAEFRFSSPESDGVTG